MFGSGSSKTINITTNFVLICTGLLVILVPITSYNDNQILPITSYNYYLIMTSNNNIIRVPKCCPPYVNRNVYFAVSYFVGFDWCGILIKEDINNNNTYIVANSSDGYDYDFIKITKGPVDICRNDSSMQTNTSFDFDFLGNGSLLTLPDRFVVPRGEFCINEYVTFNPEKPIERVARFCAPDPCIGNSKNCIHKCCPYGMAINKTTRLCQKVITAANQQGSSSVSFQWRNELGVVQSSELDPPLIRHAAINLFPDGDYIKLLPDVGDCFSILPNGSLFIPYWNKYLNGDEYCVDNYLTDNDNGSLLVIYTMSSRIIWTDPPPCCLIRKYCVRRCFFYPKSCR